MFKFNVSVAKSIALEGTILREAQALRAWAGRFDPGHDMAMKRSRMTIWYSGRVQGVGFRITVCSVAAGYEVVGTVRNLPDGRVELIAEGGREELDAFREGIKDSGLRGFIRDERVQWSEGTGEYRGFEIGRW